MMMFKAINYWVASFIPPKLYWFLAGLLHPYQAVLEDATNSEAVYKRSKDIVDLLKKLKLINQNTKLLDIGCGVGRAEYGLASLVSECVGIDISPSMISLAKKNVKQVNVSFFNTNGLNLEMFEANRFDLVFSIIVFQHVPTKVFYNYLKESYRVLNKSGKFCFQIPISQEIVERPVENHPWALRYYKTEEIVQMLRRLGFRDMKILNVNGDKFSQKEKQALITAEKI